MHIKKNIISRASFSKTAMACLLFTLTACSSGPRAVHATLPLVTATMEKPNKQEISQKYWAVLSDSSQSMYLFGDQTVTLNKIYTSALGQSCRILTLMDKDNITKNSIACENIFYDKKNREQKGWFFENMIVESSRHLELK